jgi:hypothetical protein
MGPGLHRFVKFGFFIVRRWLDKSGQPVFPDKETQNGSTRGTV